MIAAGARAFSASVASRHASTPARRRTPLRVLRQAGRSAGVLRRERRTAARLTLRLAHRLVVEDCTRTVVARTRSFEQRVERRSAATLRVVERVRRVEQAPMHTRAVVQLAAGASTPRGVGAPLAGLLAPLPRVLQKPAVLAAASPAAPEVPAPPRARTQAAPPPIDVARLTDEVMRGIDRRIAAWRERRGRV